MKLQEMKVLRYYYLFVRLSLKCSILTRSFYQSSGQLTITSNLLRRALDHRSTRAAAAAAAAKGHQRRLGSSESTKIALLCSLYQTALATLTQLKLDILTGL